MISVEQAIAIARRVLEQPTAPAGVLENGDGFVIGFPSEDPYDNVSVFVDRATGHPTLLSAGDYLTLMPSLHRVSL